MERGRMFAAGRLFAFAAAVVGMAAACDDDDDDGLGPNVASAITATTTTNNQAAILGRALANSLEVRVTNARGNPVNGVTVNWAVTGGAAAGAVSPATSTTNAQGIARTQFTLGSASTGPKTVTASVAGVTTPVTFTATAQPETFSANMNAASEVPAPTGNPTATGTATFSWNGSALAYTVTVVGNLLGNVVGTHIHGPADPGVFTGVAANLFPATGINTGVVATGSITAPSNANISMDSLLKLMRTGKAYVNVHSSVNQPGEIRGQIGQP